MSKLATLILSSILCIHISGQEAVQVFTPNAADLGKYGQIPVNYFNGLPNISIPLTIFKAKGYEIPINLTYHASGNNPNSHPGWVGLGWTLHAGGIINRIINGYKDEQSEEECRMLSDVGISSEVAYFYNAESIQNGNWSDENALNRWLENTPPARTIGTQPDEFQINIDDMQASFYIVGDGSVKIKSKSNISFKVDIRLNKSNSTYTLYKDTKGSNNMEGKLFTYIEEIIITKDNGTKYYFGGDINAIEFSFIQTPKYTEDQKRNTNVWRTIGTANSWLLKKIDIPTGEIISFTYEKKGTSIVMNDSHHGWRYSYKNGEVTAVNDTRMNNFQHNNISFIFIQPSYLTSIKSLTTNNETVFKKSETTELKYAIKQDVFEYKVGNFNNFNSASLGEFSFSNLMNQDYYMQLDEIIENNKKIKLGYSKSPQSRLKLLSVSFLDRNNQEVCSYGLEYNNVSLPSYNSKKTDQWGYYNNKFYYETQYENLSNFRTPDEHYMKAEILEKINYPTGGYSEFVYEAHDYSKVATQFDFSIVPQIGIAGGLRIKKIINHDNIKQSSRTFEYIDKQGKSSGILSGNQLYCVTGEQAVKLHYGKWWGLVYAHAGIEYRANYTIMQENNINQLSTTNGSHVTYSRIVEKLSDGGSTVYTYSNHEEFMDELPEATLDNINEKLLLNAFTSKELERGLLMRTEYLNEKGRILKTEEYTYNLNPDRYKEFVKSIYQGTFIENILYRLAYVKIYTFCPYLTAKKIISYDSEGLNSTITTTRYEYNQDKLPAKTTTNNSKNGEEIEIIHYSGDFTNGVYQQMKKRNILSHPVEKIRIRDRYVIEAELSTYKENKINSDYVIDKIYKAHMDTPIPDNSFPYFNENYDNRYDDPEITYTKYDCNSNIIESISRDSCRMTYFWGDDGLYPVAIFKNAQNNREIIPQYKAIWKTESITLKYSDLASNRKLYEFEASKDGNIEITLPGALGYNWYISGYLDEKRVDVVQARGTESYLQPPWTHYQQTYSYKNTISVSKGPHKLFIQVIEAYKSPQAGYEDGLLYYSYWDKESIAPKVTGYDNVVYENFESASKEIVTWGFHSNKSHIGAYTVSLASNPSKEYTIDYQIFKDNKWLYVKDKFENGTYTIKEGSCPIDDIRVYPNDATVASFNHNLFVGLRSRTDDRGVTESYDYDAFNRLILVRDSNQDIVRKFDYNY